MTRRLATGKLPNGQFGIRQSIPGFDALNMSLDPEKFALDASWNNVAMIHQQGYASWGGGTAPENIVFWPALPYYPTVFVMHWGGYAAVPNRLMLVPSATNVSRMEIFVTNHGLKIIPKLSRDAGTLSYICLRVPM